jgi:hypothetical protein
MKIDIVMTHKFRKLHTVKLTYNYVGAHRHAHILSITKSTNKQTS